jgi:DNA invertase Pin-like site-specific DNA recombinase
MPTYAATSLRRPPATRRRRLVAVSLDTPTLVYDLLMKTAQASTHAVASRHTVEPNPRPGLVSKEHGARLLGVEAVRRIIAYLRVSTEEQAQSGAGIDAQRAAIVVEAVRRGWNRADIEFIEDAGYSAKDLRRPGIAKALEALRVRQADTLVVAKLDRLSRSMADLTRLLETAARQGWALVALDVAVDTSTPAGEAMAHVLGTFGQLERRLIGQRTKDALAMRRAAGIRLGRPRTLPDDVVARIVALRMEGYTLQAIAGRLNDEGVPTAQGGRRWYPSTIAQVLRAAAGAVASPREPLAAPR